MWGNTVIDDAFIDRMAAKCIATSEELDALVLSGGTARIQTVNLHHLTLAARSDSFAETIDSADYITADGWPIVSLLRSRGREVERVTGSEFLERMLSGRAFRNVHAGVLGASRGAGDKFRGRLHDSGLHMVFREHGDRATWVPDQLVSELKEEDVHLLLVAVTPPHGDDIGEELLRTGFNGMVVNVGGAVDMMTASGRSIAPRWIRSIKLEWVFRMAREPRRLWRRYILECLPAFATLIVPFYLGGRRRLRKGSPAVRFFAHRRDGSHRTRELVDA
ncbi:MAG: N-acetylglucosaminyldiphosphoundecaprenol N-acetyl-beta-D-mannosaminyltransferase [Nocardioidaceae bacterium]|nr:N-acetylglucosaminyldiphosphoundecaprenol N-acetyl-beta-D-mannosaminyltransferase [Nocardioidaceae bacterium]